MTNFECMVIGVIIFIGLLAIFMTGMYRNILYLIAFISKSRMHTINVMNYVFKIWPNIATKDITMYYEQIERELEKPYVSDSDKRAILGLLNFKKRQVIQNSVDFIFYERCIVLIESSTIRGKSNRPDSSQNTIIDNFCAVIAKLLGIFLVLMVFMFSIFNIKLQRDMIIRKIIENATVTCTEEYKYCPYCGEELPKYE